MATGLRGLRSDSDMDWILEFCGFKYPPNDSRGPGAWYIPPKPGGKSKGEGITIVHPDTGYTDHPELLKGGRYKTSMARNWFDCTTLWCGTKGLDPPAKDLLRDGPGRFPSHGTATASLIMSEEGHPNGGPSPTPEFPHYKEPLTNFVSGVAPMAEVIPVRVTDSVLTWDYSESALARAINYAMSLDKEKVGVISISLGGFKLGVEQNVKKALRAAREAGIVICAAAGQAISWPTRPPTFPGSDPNTICVAACNYYHHILIEGFYGRDVDITAPGVNVWRALAERSTGTSNGTPREVYSVKQSSGTSYATPIVAGACALWQAHHGRANLIANYGCPLIFDLFKKVLQDSSHKPPNWDAVNRGAGVLDAVALLNHPLPPKSVVAQLRAEG